MKERPILFSGPMVKAILDGRKTQARRIVKPQPEEHGWSRNPDHERKTIYLDCNDGHRWAKIIDTIPQNPAQETQSFKCPYGQVGDRLWVRETHSVSEEAIYYRATDHEDHGPWKPSIFMFRKYSRINLEIVDIRLERLQYINNKDAQAEGCPHAHPHRHGNEGLLVQWPEGCGGDEIDKYRERHNTGYNDCWVCTFKQIWMDINGVRSWYEDPYVWVVEFKRVKP